MLFYGLHDTHSGKTLLEIVKNDPQYIEECVLKEDFFCLTESVIQNLMVANPKFEFNGITYKDITLLQI